MLSFDRVPYASAVTRRKNILETALWENLLKRAREYQWEWKYEIQRYGKAIICNARMRIFM